jgi:hypothetical protein
MGSIDDMALETTARQMIARHGAEAADIARDRAAQADYEGDTLSAEAWRDIAEEIERLQRP